MFVCAEQILALKCMFKSTSTWTQRDLEILVSKQNSAMKFVSLSLSPPLSLHPPFLPYQEPLPAALSSSGVAGWGYPGSYTAPESP